MIGKMPAVLSLYIHKVLIYNNMPSKVISVKPTKIVSKNRKFPKSPETKVSYTVYVRQPGQKGYYYVPKKSDEEIHTLVIYNSPVLHW